MTVRLTTNLGTRHPVVQPIDPKIHIKGSQHDFAPQVEEELIKLGHAELVSKPKPMPRKRKTKTETPTEES